MRGCGWGIRATKGYRGFGFEPPATRRCLPHAHGGAAELFPRAAELLLQAAYDLVAVRRVPQYHEPLHLALHLRLDLVQRRSRRVVAKAQVVLVIREKRGWDSPPSAYSKLSL